ncbi:hypothetical protein NUACC21_75570 [Scytonema sp. NUACC21]
MVHGLYQFHLTIQAKTALFVGHELKNRCLPVPTNVQNVEHNIPSRIIDGEKISKIRTWRNVTDSFKNLTEIEK